MANLEKNNSMLDFSVPQIMGVLNVTPDSFSDGGKYFSNQNINIEKAFARAQVMLNEGANIIDIGGESTRPGATPISVQQELDRVIPVIEVIAAKLPVRISIDTSAPEVMQAAASAGVHLINDVRALQRPHALQVASKLNLPICLMHMQGTPATMQYKPEYQNVFDDVYQFLLKRIQACELAGIDRSKLIIDPGFGFGKTVEQNLYLLHYLTKFKDLALPMLVGLSRKSMIGQILGCSVKNRLYGSLALAVLAIDKGAQIIRCHDIKATADAVLMAAAVKKVAI